jgi:hypothetical protein
VVGCWRRGKCGCGWGVLEEMGWGYVGWEEVGLERGESEMCAPRWDTLFCHGVGRGPPS